jgi:hypothetical protein
MVVFGDDDVLVTEITKNNVASMSDVKGNFNLVENGWQKGVTILLTSSLTIDVTVGWP